MPRFPLLAAALALTLLVTATPTFAQDVQNLYVGGGPVYFSLATKSVVPDSVRTETNWDLLIEGTEIKPNGLGQLLAQNYAAVTESPQTGFTEGSVRTATGGRWYNYDQNAHFLWPLPDHTLVFLFMDGRYAKMEISSYYHSETEEVRYLTFRYAVSASGVRTF